MTKNSKIEWTDNTFNPWIGCQKVAPGCEHCYAESFAKRYGKAVWGPHGTRVKTSETYWRQPLKWTKEAATNAAAFEELRNAVHRTPPHRPRVFCASLADVFEDWDGPIVNSHGSQLYHAGDNEREYEPITMNDIRRDLFALIDNTPHLDWLLLTKRPENIQRMWPGKAESGELRAESHRDNVWLLTSVSTQADADRNVRELLECRDLVPVLGLSCEPLLGPIDLTNIRHIVCGTFDALDGRSWDESEPDGKSCSTNGGIDWVIAGGESGPHARPMHPDWPRSLRDQCQAAGVAYFFKQWGEWAEGRAHDYQHFPVHGWGDSYSCRLGKKTAGRLLDGREWSEFPLNSEAAQTRMF